MRDLPLTGERTVPGIPHENYWFRRHEVAYQYIAGLAAGYAVLDIGCGEGYGAAALAKDGGIIVGIDYDAETIRHATATYPDVAFVVANLAALPVQRRTIDVVVTLQVLEHVWDHEQFLTECYRVLRPGGRLVISTPNRLTFSPGQGEPTNPFHFREFSAAELGNLIRDAGFELVAQAGVHAGSRLRDLDRRHETLVTAQLAAPPDRWSAALRADVASVRAADFTITAAADRDIDTALDLLLIARRTG
jgi:SAM-dependent methyltransferase